MAIELSNLMERSLSMLSSDHKSVVSMNLFVALLCACIVIGHLLEENRWMNESITALIIVSCLLHCFIISVNDQKKKKKKVVKLKFEFV